MKMQERNFSLPAKCISRRDIYGERQLPDDLIGIRFGLNACERHHLGLKSLTVRMQPTKALLIELKTLIEDQISLYVRCVLRDAMWGLPADTLRHVVELRSSLRVKTGPALPH